MSRHLGTMWLAKTDREYELPGVVQQIHAYLASWGIDKWHSGGIEYPTTEEEGFKLQLGRGLPAGWGSSDMPPPDVQPPCAILECLEHSFWWGYDSLYVAYFLNANMKIQQLGLLGYCPGKTCSGGREDRMLAVLTDSIALRLAEIIGSNEVQGVMYIDTLGVYLPRDVGFTWRKTNRWQCCHNNDPIPPGRPLTHYMMETVMDTCVLQTSEDLQKWIKEVDSLNKLRLEYLEDWGIFGIRLGDGTFAWLPESLVDWVSLKRPFSDIWDLFQAPTWEEYAWLHQVALSSPTVADVIARIGREPIAILPGLEGTLDTRFRRGSCDILVFDGLSESILPIYIVGAHSTLLSYALKEKERGTF